MADPTQTAISLLAVKLAEACFTMEWNALPERVRSAYRSKAVHLLATSENEGFSARVNVTLPQATETLKDIISGNLENLLRARIFGSNPEAQTFVHAGYYAVYVVMRNNVTLKQKSAAPELFDLIAGNVEASRRKYYDSLI